MTHKFNYSISTPSLWTSFDHGEVEATDYADAMNKALEKLEYDFSKANDAFKHCDNTIDFRIEFDSEVVLIQRAADEETADITCELPEQQRGIYTGYNDVTKMHHFSLFDGSTAQLKLLDNVLFDDPTFSAFDYNNSKN